jgi:hypothetical protein
LVFIAYQFVPSLVEAYTPASIPIIKILVPEVLRIIEFAAIDGNPVDITLQVLPPLVVLRTVLEVPPKVAYAILSSTGSTAKSLT